MPQTPFHCSDVPVDGWKNFKGAGLESHDDQVAEEELRARAQMDERRQLEMQLPVIAAKSSSSASIRRMSAAPIPIQRETSSSCGQMWSRPGRSRQVRPRIFPAPKTC